MILFINPILTDIHIKILQGSKVEDTVIIPRGDDFSLFPEKIMEIINTFTIEEIWLIFGPGAFTRMRIVTLCINALTLTKDIRLKGSNFFELIENAIPILQINDKEYLFQNSDGRNTYSNKEDLPNGVYSGYLLNNDFTEEKVFIQYEEVLPRIIALFEKKQSEKSLSPLYFKAPHITGSKKNTSLS